MEDVYVYLTPLPGGVKEMVTPCIDGYTVYIDSKLDEIQRLKEYHHAMEHIKDRDHQKKDVQNIEMEAH